MSPEPVPTDLARKLGREVARASRAGGRGFKLRDLAAADHQDARSRLVVTQVVTQAGNAS